MTGREEEIRTRAYAIWESEGSPEGREREHWEQASRELDGEGGEAAGTAQAAPVTEEAGKAAPSAELPSVSDHASGAPAAATPPAKTKGKKSA